MRKRLAALVAAVMLSALAFAVPAHADGQHPYTLIDPGTFGGPQSFLNLPAIPLTAPGESPGTAAPPIPHPRSPDFTRFRVGSAAPYLVHAFSWNDGHL